MSEFAGLPPLSTSVERVLAVGLNIHAQSEVAAFTMPTKVKLSEIRSLTLYAGEKTEARRSTSIPQLHCVGKPCKKYQPDVVRCTNTGGSGVEVDWKVRC